MRLHVFILGMVVSVCIIQSVQSDSNRELAEDAILEGEVTLEVNKQLKQEFKNAGIDKVQKRNSRGQLARVRGQKQAAKAIEERAIKNVAATKQLLVSTGQSLTELQNDPEVAEVWQSAICDSASPPVCNPDYKYRTADGSCNNLDNPEWGMSFTAQARYLPPKYDDGIDSPRNKGVNGELPSARVVSNAVLQNLGDSVTDSSRTLMVMAWGQFVDHDLVATPGAQGEDGTSIECCEVGQTRPECFDIMIPEDDPHFSTTCMNFVRSAAATTNSCLPSYREQLNQLTSFIDASNVYGSTLAETAMLRSFQKGQMRTSESSNLPPAGSNDTCILTEPGDHCLHCGDARANEVPNLGANHVLFLREHNRIAQVLAKRNTRWNDEKVFQETRKIVSALMQSVTYTEWIPAVISKNYRKKFSLEPASRRRQFKNYNSTINPSIKNAFAVAALRFGHSLVPPTLAYLLQDYATYSDVTPLENTFFNPHLVTANDGNAVPLLVRWITSSNSMKSDRLFEKSVRDLLFQDAAGNSFDLGALNIQRGRDHGIPSYNEWREWCALPKATSFEDMPSHTSAVAQLLKSVYNNVDDIDLYAGAVSEILEPDGDVGPTFSCILAQQFKDLKYGDRFWYESPGFEGFNRDQHETLREFKLSKIMCTNFNMDRIQADVFHKVSSNNPLKPCSSLPDLDLSKWSRRRQ